VAGARALSVCTADRERWATVRSVSKSLGPNLRLAVLAGDPATVARVEGRQLLGTGWVSGILQEIVVRFWSDAAVQARLERAERVYASRRSALIEALARRGIAASGRSGLNVYIPVAAEGAVAASLLERGWVVTPCERWRITSPPAIRVTTATLREEEAELLAAAIADATRARTGTYSA